MFETFFINAKTADFREEVLDGENHLVFPIAMLVPGVFQGNNGPVYYPEDVLSADVTNWDHKPGVVYHPQNAQGAFTTAASPEVLKNSRVGFILNTHFENKLMTEGWVNEKKANVVDKRIVEAIRKKEPMEVSTGMFMDVDVVTVNSGEPLPKFNGKEYIAIATKIRPDHLAFLPDQKGACSRMDGAGTFVVNQAAYSATSLHQTILDFQKNQLALVVNSLSFNEISTLVREELRRVYGQPGRYLDVWIEEIYPDFVVYSLDGNLWKIDYLAQSNTVVLGSEALAVRRVISYEKSTPITTNKEGAVMNRTQRIDLLVSGWGENLRPLLNTLTDDQLKVYPDKPIVTVNTGGTVTLEEMFAKSDPAMAAWYQSVKQQFTVNKAGWVETITKHPANQFTKEWLEAQPDPLLLGGIAAIAAYVPAAAVIPVVTVNQLPNMLQPTFYGNGGGPNPAHQQGTAPQVPTRKLSDNTKA